MTPPVRWSFEVEIKTDKQADSIVENLDEQERKRLFDALNKKIWMKGSKSESKEDIEKIPELEDANFRIDSTNRKEIIDPNGVKVKENPEWDVREYLEGEYKWEQLFTDTSARREANKAGKVLPASWTTYKDIIEKKYEWNHQDFLKGEKIIFAGWRGPHNEEFNTNARMFGLRCADGSDLLGNRDKSHDYGWNTDLGLSIRCIKSA